MKKLNLSYTYSIISRLRLPKKKYMKLKNYPPRITKFGVLKYYHPMLVMDVRMGRTAFAILPQVEKAKPKRILYGS
jgi:hypothetical protein